MSSTPDRRQIQPWDQRPDETSKAYHRFCVYRDMGPDRSIEKVRKKLGKKSGYQRHLEKWSSQHEWVARAKAYDKHEVERMKAEREEIRERGRQMYIDKLEALIEKHIDIALQHGAEIDPDTGKLQFTTNSAQVKAIVEALDRAGVTVPKEIQISAQPKRLIFAEWEDDE